MEVAMMVNEGPTLDEILAGKKPRGRRGCPICGAKNEAAVSARITRLDKKGQQANTAGTTVSVSVSLCGDCAAQVWVDLSGRVEKLRRGA